MPLEPKLIDSIIKLFKKKKSVVHLHDKILLGHKKIEGNPSWPVHSVVRAHAIPVKGKYQGCRFSPWPLTPCATATNLSISISLPLPLLLSPSLKNNGKNILSYKNWWEAF